MTTERSGVQDTGAAVTDDAAKAKGMTAPRVSGASEQLVLLVRMEVC